MGGVGWVMEGGGGARGGAGAVRVWVGVGVGARGGGGGRRAALDRSSAHQDERDAATEHGSNGRGVGGARQAGPRESRT